MVYFLNLIYSVVDSYLIGKFTYRAHLSGSAFGLLLLPIFIVWILICGGQDNVGTDYPAYIRLFNGESLDRYEPGFVFIVNACLSLGIKGQAIYFVFYAIGFFFLGLVLRRIDIKYVFIFILLYISVSGLFNNQLNILRQVITTYIGSYGVLLMLDNKKFRGSIIILLASSIHFCGLLFSIIRLLFFLFFLNRIVAALNKRRMILCVLCALILSFVFTSEMLNHLDFLIPNIYIKFLNSGAIESRSFILKITKYLFVPLYLAALFKYDKDLVLSSTEQKLFKWGIVSLCLRLSLLNMTIISRVSDVFLIVSLYPLLYYFRYLYLKHKRRWGLAVCYVVGLYFAKVLLFPSAEYSYQSIYGNFI